MTYDWSSAPTEKLPLPRKIRYVRFGLPRAEVWMCSGVRFTACGILLTNAVQLRDDPHSHHDVLLPMPMNVQDIHTIEED